MGYTGYKVIQYIDENPLSPTYGQTWTEKVLDYNRCNPDFEDWEVVSETCEMDTSGYTGNKIIIYHNEGTGQYSSTTEYDESCVPSSIEEVWVATGEEWCEQINGANTGYKIQIQKQVNSNLANYGQTREYRYASPDCTAAGTSCAVWDEISRSCHIMVYNCTLTYDGTADVVQIDSNPLSETYNQTRTINIEDSGCTNCTNTTFGYVEIGDFCGYDTCYSGLTDDPTPTNLYTVSQKHKTISGTSYPMGEFLVVLKQEESEDCGYIRPRYRWVNTQGRVCVEYDLYGVEKEQVSYDLGETWADYFVDGQLVTRTTAEPIATDVYTCGYPMYRWVNTDETECALCENSEFRWVVQEGTTMCDGVALKKVEVQQVSCDGGETWNDFYGAETRPGETIDEYSDECGLTDYRGFLYNSGGELVETLPCEQSTHFNIPNRLSSTTYVKKVVVEGCCKTVGLIANCASGQFGFNLEEIVIGDGIEEITGFLVYSEGSHASTRPQIRKITFGKNLKRVSAQYLFYTLQAPQYGVNLYLTGEYPPTFDYDTYMYGSGSYHWYAPLEYKENYRTLFFFNQITFI